jgi:hypothetical protein
MNNEEKIEELKNALRQLMQIIIARDSPLSDEMKMNLSKVIEHVGNRINELRQLSGPSGPPKEPIPPLPPIPPAPYESSNINAFKYDPESGKLLVKFHGKDTADSGPIYSYDDVPEYIFDIFRRGAVGPKTTGANKYHAWYKGITPSLGAAMSALIKKGPYPYTRIAA